MADNTPFTGNLGADPELRYTPNGKAVATFNLGKTDRRMDPTTREWTDGDTLWLRVEVWNEQAENVAASLTKGTSVVVLGQLKSNNYEKDGVKREGVKVVADLVAPSLKNATAKVERKARAAGGSNGGGYSGGGNSAPAGNAGSFGGSDDTPF
jgi:single-strand DNA-binding protein